ncbi:MAG TPA: hypothetical protein VGT78_06055 [Rhizomicrobium sp.]|nr:hypothetical protein [Rhizomicrobium sp.]
MKHAKLVEDAKLDPQRYYTQPSDVLRDRRLTDPDRLEILAAWERDARALSVASDESMGGGEPNRLRDVVKARLELEERLNIHHDYSESSKFGGGTEKKTG